MNPIFILLVILCGMIVWGVLTLLINMIVDIFKKDTKGDTNE